MTNKHHCGTPYTDNGGPYLYCPKCNRHVVKQRKLYGFRGAPP